MQDLINAKGQIELIATNVITGEKTVVYSNNTVLNGGKVLLAKSLAGPSSPYSYNITQMAFGSGGQNDSVPRPVDASRTTLFNQIGVITANSPSDVQSTRVSFTGSLETTSLNDENRKINEAGLVTASGDLFSMVTFAGLTKTADLSFTLTWTIIFA